MRFERAFSIVELVVVIGIITIVAGILFPVIARVRDRSKQLECSSNQRQIGVAMYNYSNDNRGVIPRYALGYNQEYGPVWVTAISRYIGIEFSGSWSVFKTSRIYQCPAHPTPGIPTAFIVNCFAFNSAPLWTGAPPLRLSAAKNTSQLAWLAEASDRFGTFDNGSTFDDVFFEPYHIARSPSHLPRQTHSRISDQRHGGRQCNVMFLDGHVESIGRGKLTLEMFDDRRR